VSARAPSVLIVGEFGPGALALSYERAFLVLGWRTVRYDVTLGYTRGGVLARRRMLRRALRPALWALMSRETVALAARERPDLVLSVKAPFLSPAAMRALKQAAAGPVVMVYPDSPYGAYTQRRDVPAVLAACDRVYIWSHALRKRLQGDGVTSAVYLPFAYDPADYGAEGAVGRPPCGRSHAIAFIGQRYDKREAWLGALAGLDLGVWGLGWEGSRLERQGGVCVHRDGAQGAGAAAIYRGARAALNVLHEDNLAGHNMRTFEIPPCRTVMLTEATADIEAFFEPDRACLLASDPSSLRAQAERVLGDERLARAVADGGVRAGRPHTYEARAREIVADVVGNRPLLAHGRG
jgi:glycosyl transferase family 1